MLKTMKIKVATALLLTSVLAVGNAFCAGKFDLLKHISKDAQMVVYANVKGIADNPAVSKAIDEATSKSGNNEFAAVKKTAAKYGMDLGDIIQEIAFCGGTSAGMPFAYGVVKLNYPHKKLLELWTDEKQFNLTASSHSYKGRPLYMIKDSCSVFFVTDTIAMVIPDKFQVHEVVNVTEGENFFKNKELVSYYKKVCNHKVWMVLRPDTAAPSPGGVKKALAAFDIKGKNLALLFKVKMNNDKAADNIKNSYAMFKMMALAQTNNMKNPKLGQEFINKLKINFSKDMIIGSLKCSIGELEKLAEEAAAIKGQRMMPPQQGGAGAVHKF